MGREQALILLFSLPFQGWVGTGGPSVPPGWHCISSPGSLPRTELGEPQGTAKKLWGLLSKGKQLLRKLASGKE